MTNPPALDRRAAIRLGMAAAAAALPAGAAARTRPLDPADPADERLIYRKLRYRTDDGLIFSWVKGPYMAAIGGDLIPMYAINLGSLSRVTQRADGGFDLIDLEISFRTDIASGRRLTSFRNLVTGETVPVAVRPQGPNRLTMTADDTLSIGEVPGGPHFELTRYPARPSVVGDSVILLDRSHSRVTAPDGSVSLLNEVSTFSAPAAAVLDPATTSVATRVSSNDVRSWPGWLNMGARAGTLNLFATGGKVAHFADLPADWQAMLHEAFPAIAADPIAALDAVPPR